MPVVECLIVREGRLLMVRGPSGEARSGLLLAIGGPVETGESPLAACMRRVVEETGWHVAPSCVAVIFNEPASRMSDYRLSFIAEAPAGEPVPSSQESSLEWVALDDLPHREDVPAVERQLIPRLLASSQPVAVILKVDTTTEPHTAQVAEVSIIDPARLSPLVFSVTT